MAVSLEYHDQRAPYEESVVKFSFQGIFLAAIDKRVHFLINPVNIKNNLFSR